MNKKNEETVPQEKMEDVIFLFMKACGFSAAKCS